MSMLRRSSSEAHHVSLRIIEFQKKKITTEIAKQVQHTLDKAFLSDVVSVHHR